MNRFSAALAALFLVPACSGAPPEAPPLAGARIGGPFRLTDQAGRTVTNRDFAGRWRIMYFGYTFCPDVCPTDAGAIGGGLKRFEADSPKLAAVVTPVFVTLDPERDTPAVLRQFVSGFHPRMVGLTGSPQAIGAIAKAYGVYFKRSQPTAAGGYLVDHQRATFLMDPQGRPVALIPSDQGADAVARELERWVR